MLGRADNVSKPYLLYTDGALEYGNDKAIPTIGAVLVEPCGRARAFGCTVPESVMADWQVDGKIHVIGLVELYACVVGISH